MYRPSLHVLAFGILAASCGPGGANPTSPDAPRFEDVDPERARVSVISKMTEPFVIDWRPEHRTKLEIALKRGPAIVRFDRKSFEVLADCRPAGASYSYEYTGVIPKPEKKVWRSRAELHVNFPAGAVDLEGYLRGGGEIRTEIFIVGQQSLLGDVRADQLQGDCAGASHVVRRVTVGAFRLVTAGSKAAGGQVSVLGRGASGDSSGETGQFGGEGDFQACNAADPDSPQAPSRCRSVLQVLIVPLARAEEVAAPRPVAPGPPSRQAQVEERPECGEGLRWDGSGCVSVARVEAESRAGKGDTRGFECDPSNAQECVAQCKAGNLASCTHLGWHLYSGSQGVSQDRNRALQLWQVSCKAKEGRACQALNIHFTEAQDWQKALVYGGAGCQYGDAGSCTNVGVQAFFGRGTKQNRQTAFKLWHRACKLRDFQACSNVGVMILHGLDGVPRDQAAARKLFEKACAAPGKPGCANLADTLYLGLGGPKDLARALKLYVEACEGGNAVSCVGAGLAVEENSQAPENLRRALDLYEKGCGFPPSGGCLTEQELRSSLPGVYSDSGYERRACDGADQASLACFNAGVAAERGYGGQVDVGRAQQYLKKACNAGLKKACRDPRPGMPRRL